MAFVKFNVACTAVYPSELEIPNSIRNNDAKILEYIRSHLADCKMVGEMDWISDLDPDDAVTMEDIKSIE